jgi:hypothetical protein
MNADIFAVIDAEDRISLTNFHEQPLKPLRLTAP